MRRIVRAVPWLWLGLSLAAQTVTPALDPVCGLPRLSLSSTSPDRVYELQATDDLGAPGVWETLIRVAPGMHPVPWLDPDAPGRGRRFYRLTSAPLGPALPTENFALNDQYGVRRELFREADAGAVALVFTDNRNLAAAWEEVRQLQADYEARGVRFWIINPADSREAVHAACMHLGVTAPVLHDAAQLVARTYVATTAMESILLERTELSTLYRGPVADHCETDGAVVHQAYLRQALDQFTRGLPVTVQEVRVRGGALPLPALEVPSYTREIAPLLQARCVTCHRPGDIGSWAMTNHAAVAAQAVAIRRSVLAGHMPPWHADPAFGHFANDGSLRPSEAAQLVAWLDAGAPAEAGEDPLAASPPPPPAAWPLGTPDLVLSIPTQSLPARGEIPYQYLLVKNPLMTNVWLRAATVRPGNREVVHHSLVFSARTVADFLEVQGGLGGFFAGYVPGTDPVEYPAGTGKLLKTGGYLVFQMHYTPNGSATSDRTQIGLYFARSVPARELVTTAAYDTEFSIPPGARDHEVVAEALIARDSLLYEMSPHMHYRGARMRFEAVYPDGRREILLNVPGYEFAWQTLFRLAEPKRLPAGTRIQVTGGFDNSAANPWNPDPTRTVLFGEQTHDEMLIGYLNLAAE